MTDVKAKKQTINTYDKSAKFHADKFDEIGTRIEDIELTYSKVKKKNPKTIELGCGNGRDAVEIIKHTNDYLGIDLSSELIKLAKKKVGEKYFKVADIETFKFPKNIDVVFTFASLLHSDKVSVKKVLNNIYKNMNKGGVIFISLKYDKYQKRLMYKEHQGYKTFYFYTPEDIKEIAPEGFKSVFEEIQDFKGQNWFSLILQKE
jgi:ubiquinone/menaquinone biosynthesis C-methylase UbiE